MSNDASEIGCIYIQDAGAAFCAVCRRPVRRKSKGRPKEVHTTCCILRSRMAEMEAMLRRMEFGDAEAVRRLRGDIMAMMNVTLRADVVTINPANDADI
jgi:hypothetical protein